MNLLADENFPLLSVALLREAGHDVVSIHEISPGMDDEPVLDLAVRQQRILITFDKDFGSLAFLRGANCPPGVLFLRFQPRTPHEPGEWILHLIGDAKIHLMGNFTVFDRERIRQRRLPRGAT
jgi:predicted nuclease of predicted toxin-antitoxin system